MAKLPKKKKWPKGLPKPGSSAYNRRIERLAENKKIEAAIAATRKKLKKT